MSGGHPRIMALEGSQRRDSVNRKLAFLARAGLVPHPRRAWWKSADWS